MIVLPLLLGVIAFGYIHILLSPGMLLARFADWAHKILPKFLYKPFFDCSRCFAGQLGLWCYLIIYLDSYNVVYHAWYIVGSVVTAYFVELIDMKISYQKEITKLEKLKKHINESKRHISKGQKRKGR